LKAAAEEIEVPVFEVDGLAETSFSFKGIKEIKKVLKGMNADIVHTHGAVSGRIAAKLAKVPHITYTRHSVFEPPKGFKGLKRRIMGSTLNKWIKCDIIAVAGAAKQNAVDEGVPAERVQVIYNGVEQLEVKSAEEKKAFLEKYGLTWRVPTLAIAARLTAVKGQKYVVWAAKILKERGIKCQFIIAGTGEDEKELRELVKKLDVEDYVVVAGFVTDVATLMNAMDIQVNASFGTEAASLSLMEGMSLGKPAIVSDYGGNPELIADGVNGFMTKQHAPDAIAECVEKLFEDRELWKNMAANARKTYEERFTAKKMTQNMQNFYKGLMK
jgi:glycosyltransferase involved in cell wall biosynthesis